MTSEKSQNSLQIWQITKFNLRHNCMPLLILSDIVMILTPVLFGTTNLDSLGTAVPLEMLISTMGIILLVPIFQPEQNSEIEDIVTSKFVDCIYVYVIRVAYSVIGLALLILVFSCYMLVCGCHISVALIFGTLADAMFLGSIGLFTAAITNNLPVSIMIQMPYADLVVADLVIEYIGYECFQSAIRQISPRYVSAIIQINTDDSYVSDSPYLHVFDRLDEVHHQMEETALVDAMEQIGYIKAARAEAELPNGKRLVRMDFAS